MDVLLVDREVAREETARRDRERLQGAWTFVSGKRKARLLIAGNRFTMQFKSGDIYMGAFTLDPTSRPRAMDLHIEEGPEHHRGKTALAIYEFDGEHLIWCPTDPARTERASAFPPPEDMNALCIIFRREKK